MLTTWSDNTLDKLKNSSGIQVWKFSLDFSEEQTGHYLRKLPDHEQNYARHLKNPSRRRQFIISRAILRRLLAKYLHTDSQTLEFCKNQYGKPSLNRESLTERNSEFENRYRQCEFNLSHSNQFALLGISTIGKLGIDIQHHRRRLNVCKFARRFFTSVESQLIDSLPDDKKQQVFFQLWTRKEAVLKSLGQGISYGIAKLDVSEAIHTDSTIAIKTNNKIYSVVNLPMNDTDKPQRYSAAVSLCDQSIESINLYNLVL